MFNNKQDISLKEFFSPVLDLFSPLTTIKSIHIIAIFGFIVFGNALFNNFVGDDKKYIINNPQMQQVSLSASFGVNSFNTTGQYRPLPSLYFALLYSLFGATPFMYHLLQILLHIAATSLLYILFCKYLSSGVSLVAALVFLVHPMQVESVSYIAQTASPLFFLLGIIPLFLCMRDTVSAKTVAFSFFLVLLSMFVKETGILFLFMIFVYSILFARKNFIRLSIGGFITIAVYAFFRFYIGHVGFETRPIAPIASLSLSDRLLNIPIILFYYVKTFLFPKSLAYDQQWVINLINVSTFYLPLILDLALFTVICVAGLYIFRHHKSSFKPFLFFSAWFALGLFFLLNIFPLDETVADRWFYVPLAGLLGLAGLIYQNLAKKITVSGKWSFMPSMLSLLIILPLSVRTVVRNSDWQNSIKLFTHDIQISDSFSIEDTLGNEYAKAGAYTHALHSFERAAALRPNEYDFMNIGIMYWILGNIEKSKEYYKKALQVKSYGEFLPHKHSLNFYISYAELLLFHDSTSQTLSFTRKALHDYPDNSELWNILALSRHKEHDIQGAMDAATKAYQLNPNNQFADIYTQLLHNENEAINVFFLGKNFTF